MSVNLEAMQEEMSERIQSAIQQYTTNDERSQQAARFQIGISDLGHCSEYVRRMLTGEEAEDPSMFKAFIGTALGEFAERAIAWYGWTEALTQQTVTLKLRDEAHDYLIPGHPDIILPWGVVLDGKTTAALGVMERTGMENRQKRFQRHGYAKAAWDAGLFNKDVKLEDVIVGNFWLDRTGENPKPLVRLEIYDPEVIQEMTDWVTEVIYAFTHNTEARKEPPREMCAVACRFFATCRAYDTDVSGLLTDDEVLTAIVMYSEGGELAKLGANMKEQAKSVLRDVEGFAMVGGKRVSLRWTHVNEVLTKPSVRRAHDKIEVRVLP